MLPDVEQGKTASAVGVFCLARRKRRLTHQSSLLIAQIACNRHICQFALRYTVNLTAGADLWQHRWWNAERLQNVRVPLQSVEVEQQCAASVSDIGKMPTASYPAGQVPDEPAIHSAEQDFAIFYRPTVLGQGVEQPTNFRAAKVSSQR
ncbi:hypothetical protein HRbin36_02061 [bacterium HR36]|nr:hypothetical protein HRbin36_02061 [bacterium HR36]